MIFYVLPAEPADGFLIRLFRFYILEDLYNADKWPLQWFHLAGELIAALHVMHLYRHLFKI